MLVAWTTCPDRCQVSASQPVSATQVALVVKNLPPVQETQETQLRSLGAVDPLEEGMETHSSILAWRIPWRRSLVGYSP